MEEASLSSSSEVDGLKTLDEMEEDDEDICIEDLPMETNGHDLSPLDMDEHDREAGDNDVGGEENSKVLLTASYDLKLRELLRNICSIEVAVYSRASKEFVRLLRGDSGGELLCQYVRASPSCMELMEVWKMRQGKPGMAHVLSLISAILDHPDGKYHMEDLARLAISRRLDKLARSILTTKLEDVYAELNSREAKRQSAALSLMAAVVRRGVGLASEVAKSFNFKLAMFPKLADVQPMKGGKKMKHSTRLSFIEFAMSFLEVGNPRLLRWILQQKDMYFGVLRGLSSDDEKTVVYVLSKLRDKILSPELLVPVGLRSVLFGSVTLEQLSGISGNPIGGPAADMAHEILIMVCTDPCNGLMPDWKPGTNPLRGNPKRLLGLMKKLKATEIGHHKDLLLAIVNGRPSLCSAYMDEFPYILEPRPTRLWFAAISLAADLISSTMARLSFASLCSQFCDLPLLEGLEIQCILKCIIPRAFTRLVINRGLLHSDFLVKHGTLRLLLEALKALDKLIGTVNVALENMLVDGPAVTIHSGLSKLNGSLGIGDFGNVDKSPNIHEVGKSCTYNLSVQKWVSFKQEIQNELRAMLPDPQVLFKLLSSLSHGQSKTSEMSLKRCRASEYLPEVKSSDGVKKLRSDSIDENIDIIIGGVSTEHSTATPGVCEKVKDNFVTEEADTEKDHMIVVAGIWGLHEFSAIGNKLKDGGTYFHSKLLDVLTLYLRTLLFGLDGSFDFFKILPSNPLILPINVQQSLLSLLIEYIGQSPGSSVSIRVPDLLYKHLQSLINLLIYSPVKGIQDQAYVLARAAMLSTGAFHRNPAEIDAWFLFLPGYNKNNCSVRSKGDEVFRDLSAAVVSFFCDSVSTVGNNLYKHLDHLRRLVSKLEVVEDLSLDFSPLVACILQKCLRLLESDSGTFKLPERSMISIYVCNTLSSILQTQVEVGSLSFLIDLILTEKLEDLCFGKDGSRTSLCEWRPIKNLHLFVQSMFHQQACCSVYSCTEAATSGDRHSILKILHKVKKIKESGHVDGLDKVAIAFSSAILCAEPDDLLENFPFLITIAQQLLGDNISLLSSIFFHERKLLSGVANLWPDMFFSSLEMVGTTICSSYQKDDACLLSTDFGSADTSAVAFSLFLKHMPFHALFSAMMTFGNSDLLGSTKLLDLLRAKLSECSMDSCISSLRLVLFWVHQVQLSFRAKPSNEMERLLETCFILTEHMLTRLLVVPSDFDSSKMDVASPMTTGIQELAEIIFCHPAVALSLSHPFSCNKKLTNGDFGDSLEGFLSLSKQCIHSTDHHILHLLKRVADYMLSVGNAQSSISKLFDSVHRPALNAFKLLIRQAVLVFKNKFDQYIMMKDLIPLLQSFYIFHALMCFVSPFELLELVHWVFCKADQNDRIGWTSSGFSVLAVGFYIADCAFDILSSNLHQRHTATTACHLFREMEDISFDFMLLKEVYYKIIDYAICFRLECADLCLLKAVNSVYSLKFMPPNTALLPLSMTISRMIISSPLKVLIHFIHKTSKTKAKALFQLTEVSPLHLSLFGQIFLYILNKDLLDVDSVDADYILQQKGEVFLKKCSFTLSDEEFLLLLPAALSYLTSITVKFGKQYVKHFRSIPFFYSRILFDGFSNWKSYISGDTFQEEYNEFIPKSIEAFLSICTSSLLGKAIHLLRYYFSLNGNSMSNKKRMKIFNSVYPRSSVHNELLDCDLSEIDVQSPKQLLNFTNGIVAKIYLSRMILFPHDKTVQFPPMAIDLSLKEMPLETESDDRLELTKLRFMNIMISALDKIVKTFPLRPGDSKHLNGSVCSQFFRCLEVFILRNIVEISMGMQSELIQLHAIPFLEPFIRSSLLHRFEDPTTLKALSGILVSLSEGKFSSGEVFELLLAHSQFVPTILWSDSTSDSSGLSQSGTFWRPISSILKLLVLPSTNQSAAYAKNLSETSSEQYSLYERKLEVIKLLRILYRLKANHHSAHPGKHACMNSRELLSLLLSGYGATLNETDLEIFHLMYEIESIEGSECGSIADMDYLWGSSALKLRREQMLERFLSSSNLADCETAEDRQRRQYRENIPVDSKICIMTVLHFCHDRVSWTGPMPLEKLQLDQFVDSSETPSASAGRIQRYDPAFILRFSIHGLSMGYIEPVEFAGLGLLAVAFVSLSSPDEGIRKLGYEALGRFKKSLENCRNIKDGLRLRLLLTYLQNGIVEPWQKIPSPMAIFVAEASFILLDPSHDHYQTISKFLMRSPRVDLKSIPLFYTLFGSSSVHFKTERLWILRLLYAGLKLDDDAQIFMRKCLLEHLLSFYVSSLSDNESKVLILQIVKKSVEFHRLAYYLVDQCGLISWLSSILSFSRAELFGDHKDFCLTQTTTVLEVVNVVISARILVEWLQKYGLEQLSELSFHLHTLFISGLKSLKENVELVNSIFGVLVSTLRISQKRKIYQPHFTLTVDGLFQIFQAVDEFSGMRFGLTAEFGLKTILMSTPPAIIFLVDREKLSKLLMWAVPTALQASLPKEFDPHLTLSEEQSEDSLISKLLRWLTASVILGRVSSKSSKTSFSLPREQSRIETLQSLLEHVNKGWIESRENVRGIDEVVAATLLYLQQLIGTNCRVLASVVSALCLLLHSDAANSTGLDDASDPLNDEDSSHTPFLCSKIRCPVEANPSWRWSYYQPWKDLSWEQTDEQKIDERHACQTLLMMFSNALGGKASGLPVLSHRDVENSGLCMWEREIILRSE
ncbi:uncharacterized protein LOC131219338 isoform X2 [Magnolia sinica]|uniref:uncharacterized protein LOC131219338 isoform X2 n=1 Tax=Magnolia sinica TaxID=86752 RepID=UPI00265AA5EF|nr:uncharacterized protein LOC131219338 isoform X2 [Magnolia sinica]